MCNENPNLKHSYFGDIVYQNQKVLFQTLPNIDTCFLYIAKILLDKRSMLLILKSLVLFLPFKYSSFLSGRTVLEI